jgi:serine/threonine-protein kinase HipA
MNDAVLQSLKHLSIGGKQKKVSLTLVKNKLTLTQKDVEGQFILKLPPEDIGHADETAANEHLTMQLASQVFGVRTAWNTLIFFQNGQPAYLTKRFDYFDNGLKAGIENFSSLRNDTKQTSYNNVGQMSEKLFKLLREYVGPYRIEGEHLFKRILFNRLVSNTEDDIKNYSLIETVSGDYILSPAYDLICSSLHREDEAGKDKWPYLQLMNAALDAGLHEATIINLCRFQLSGSQAVESLTRRSFLSPAAQEKFLALFQENVKQLSRALEDS